MFIDFYEDIIPQDLQEKTLTSVVPKLLAIDFDRSFCMAAICCSGTSSATLTNKQLLGEKRTCAKFENDNSTTDGLVDRRADEQSWLNRLSAPLQWTQLDL